MAVKSYFDTLNSIDVNEKIEKKGGLSYLSWAWAWGEVKKLYPDSNYNIYENADGLNYHTDGRTGWVKTGVVVEGIEHIEYLPIMDYKNNSISLEKITSFNVNTAIQRSLTKAVARHGLGLYIYAGEDLPEKTSEDVEVKDVIVKDKDELIRPNTLAQIKEQVATFDREKLGKFNGWVYKGFDRTRLEDLTEQQGRLIIQKIA